MMVVVEGRRQRCWSCKQLGHISKFCPQKDPPSAAVSTASTTTTTATITTATISSTIAKESGQVQPKKAEVTRKKKKSPKKVEDKASTMTVTAVASPAKGTDSERFPQKSPPKSPPKHHNTYQNP